ncbi:receptor like protein 30-like [Durio zibethinus]|uniref:Receptor like protein 30-like n=1 Tax=Durio zibethinus TaxID=66656 RepID=A0A6P5ZMP2_DURZI|nr:receptor like protein 30-like [Durio zibethinus]
MGKALVMEFNTYEELNLMPWWFYVGMNMLFMSSVTQNVWFGPLIDHKPFIKHNQKTRVCAYFSTKKICRKLHAMYFLGVMEFDKYVKTECAIFNEFLGNKMEWKWLWVVLVAFLLGRCYECERCWEQEKITLLQLKPFFTHIEDVKNYWVDEGKQSSDCCRWKRVECNTSTGRVIRLFLNFTITVVYGDLVDNYYHHHYYIYYLEEYDWSGKDSWYLNASLFLPFEELKSLYLGGNSIAGCIDNQGFERLSLKLDKLEILDLSVNQFNDSILASLSELSSLKSLNLAENTFTGSNPIEGMKRLSKLNKLETLDLYGNEFNNLTNLKELYLGENQIESLGSLFQSNEQLRLIKLEVLGLSENLFNKSIFSSLAMLSNLKSLYIKSNKLDGPIHIKELNALTNLVELDISGNQVNGFVPSKDNETELRLINLEVLHLYWNLFNCSILSSLGRLSNLKSLSLGGYNLKGSIDLKGLDALNNLENLFISCYYTRACSLSPQSLDLFPSLKTLYLEGFSFNGTLTTQWQNLTSLEELMLEDSFFPSNFIQDIGMLTSLKNLSNSFEEFGILGHRGRFPGKQLSSKNWSNAFSQESRIMGLRTQWHLTFPRLRLIYTLPLF